MPKIVKHKSDNWISPTEFTGDSTVDLYRQAQGADLAFYRYLFNSKKGEKDMRDRTIEMFETMNSSGEMVRVPKRPSDSPLDSDNVKYESEEHNEFGFDTDGKPFNLPHPVKRKDDLIIGIRVAAMHIYSRAEKYVDEITVPDSTCISIDFDEYGIPSVSINKTEFVVTSDHVENSLDIKKMWGEQDADNR